MNIHYLTRMNLSSVKAHVYNTARTCEALNMQNCCSVSLVSSDGSIRTKEGLSKYFLANNVMHPFGVTCLNSWSRFFSKKNIRIMNYIEVFLANISLSKYILVNFRSIDVIYFRDPLVVLPILIGKFIARKPIFFEIHAVLVRKSTQRISEYLATISDGIINISHGLDMYYRPFNRRSMVSFCAAAEPERFEAIEDSKALLRTALDLPQNMIICMYTGNLYRTGNNDSYGIDDIIRAFPLLDERYIFVGVGKKGNETAVLESLAKKLNVFGRILFVPWVPKNEIVKYIMASDILLIPAAGARIGNSPTKMFEYLVSGRPIIGARTEAIAEVLRDGQNALLVDYSKPQSWADAIIHMTNDSVLRKSIINQAMSDGRKLTWNKRGEDILRFIGECLER